MSINVNKAILVGRVGQDPEVKSNDVVTFSMATSETWRDDRGEKQERTQWHKVVIFNKQSAKYVAQYVKKGDLVMVEGQIETRKWEREGQEDKYFTEIIVRPYSGNVQSIPSQKRDTQPSQSSQEETALEQFAGRRVSTLDDDEIPFAPEYR
jgi:single stranded DNA-binding protein (ssb)